jgi:polyisoprenoid-binding protein YceI
MRENAPQPRDLDLESAGHGLTNHLKSPEFFDVAKFPTSTFVSTGIEVGGKDPRPGMRPTP